MDVQEKALDTVLRSNLQNLQEQEVIDSDLPEEPSQSSPPSSQSSSFLVGSSGSEFSHFFRDEDEEFPGEDSPRVGDLHDKKYILKLRRLFGESSESVSSELIKLSGSYEDRKQLEKKLEKLSKMLGESSADALKIGEGKTPPTDGEQQSTPHQKTKIRNVVGKLMRATKGTLTSYSSSPISKDSMSPLTPKSPKSPLIKIGEMEIEPGSLQEKLILDLLEDRLLEVEREEEYQKYAVAFGVKRGDCAPPCECPQYVSPTTDLHKGGNCIQCGHYPAQHKNLGLIAVPESKSDLVNGLKTEIARFRSQSLVSPVTHHKDSFQEKRGRFLSEYGSPSAFRRVIEGVPALKLDFANDENNNNNNNNNSNSNTPQEGGSPTGQTTPTTWVSAIPGPRSASSPRNSNPSTPRTSNPPPTPVTPRSSNPGTPRSTNPTPVTPRNSNPGTPRSSNSPIPTTPKSSNSRPGSASQNTPTTRPIPSNISPRSKEAASFIPISPQRSSPEKDPPSPPGLFNRFRSLSPTTAMLKRQGSVKTIPHSASFPMTGNSVPMAPNSVVRGFKPSDLGFDLDSFENNTEVSQSESSDSISEDMEFTNSLQSSPPTPSKKGIDSLKISPSWIIAGKELQFIQKLASGSSAKVFKGTYRNQEVAIKVLKALPEGKQLEDFKKEFEIMSCLRSPNVVYFYGTVLAPKVCIIMEYCSKGSLFDVLKDETVVFDWGRFFKFSIESMRGVNCLHSWKPQIVHRDLKSLNLLIDENWICKLADFGTSRFLSGKQSTLGKVRGTYAYCCPEVYFGKPFTAKSDIYSFGIILWEMIVRVIRGTYERPYSEYPEIAFDFQTLLQAAKHNLRPKIPPTCPEALADLVQSCWASEPDNRLDSKEALEKLLELQKTLEKEPKPWNKAIEKKKRRFSIVSLHN